MAWSVGVAVDPVSSDQGLDAAADYSAAADLRAGYSIKQRSIAFFAR